MFASIAGEGCVRIGSGFAVVPGAMERLGRGTAGSGRLGRKSALPEPSPLDGDARLGSPPVMLIPGGPFPAPFGLPPVPPGLPAPPPEPPVDPSTPAALPPGTPGCAPSGEITTRAERFPAGTCNPGAGGAGVAERAMMFLVPASPLGGLGPRSGAGSISFVAVRGPDRATAEGASSSFGRAISTLLGAMFKSPAKRCSAGTMGAAVSGNGRLASLRRNRERLSESFGRGGRAVWFHCTMLGNGGRIFGASGGASG